MELRPHCGWSGPHRALPSHSPFSFRMNVRVFGFECGQKRVRLVMGLQSANLETSSVL